MLHQSILHWRTIEVPSFSFDFNTNLAEISSALFCIFFNPLPSLTWFLSKPFPLSSLGHELIILHLIC